MGFKRFQHAVGVSRHTFGGCGKLLWMGSSLNIFSPYMITVVARILEEGF